MNSRVEELEKENAHLKREMEIMGLRGTGTHEGEEYWMHRCMDAENKLGVLDIKYRNDTRKLRAEVDRLRDYLQCKEKQTKLNPDAAGR